MAPLGSTGVFGVGIPKCVMHIHLQSSTVEAEAGVQGYSLLPKEFMDTLC